jgi:hypothetical protein
MQQSTYLRNSDVIKRNRNLLQLLLAKALIICTSEAPRTVKKEQRCLGRYRDKLRAQWSGVHIVL